MRIRLHSRPAASRFQKRICKQFFHGKGLCQIIVSSCVQCFDLVPVFTPGADDNNGQIGPGADIPDHFHAVHVREAKIQPHNIRAVSNTALETYVSGSVATLAFVLAITNVLCPFMVRFSLKRHPADPQQVNE